MVITLFQLLVSILFSNCKTTINIINLWAYNHVGYSTILSVFFWLFQYYVNLTYSKSAWVRARMTCLSKIDIMQIQIILSINPCVFLKDLPYSLKFLHFLSFSRNSLCGPGMYSLIKSKKSCLSISIYTDQLLNFQSKSSEDSQGAGIK